MSDKIVEISVHSCKETNWEIGEEIGLSEDAINSNFKYTLYEVLFTLKVNDDGTSDILQMQTNGKKFELKEIL